jgi:hypothetical protein
MTSEKILHININGFGANSPNLQHLISTFDSPPVLSINDTRTSSANPCTLPGYQIFNQDFSEPGKAGGVAICIPSGWSGLQLKTITETDCLSIRISSPSGLVFKMASMYIHGNRKPSPHLLKKIMDYKPYGRNMPTIICGDFNSPHTSLGGSYSNASGIALTQILEDLDLIPLNDFSIPTYYSASNASSNVLDLMISTRDFLTSIDNFSAADSIGSDHIPILLSLSTHHSSSNFTVIKYNWTTFKYVLENRPINLNPANSEHEINNWVTKLTENIQEALVIASRKKTVRTRKGFAISDESSRLIQLRRLLLRKRKICSPDSVEGSVIRYLCNQSNKRVRESLRKDEEQSWRQLANKIASADPSVRWKIVNKFRSTTTQTLSPLIDSQGKLATSEVEIANTHADKLSQTHTIPNEPGMDNEWKSNVETWVGDNSTIFHPLACPTNEDNDEELPPVGDSELLDVIMNLKSKSSPGEDGITYTAIKNLPPVYRDYLKSIYDASFHLGVFPNAWKLARVTMLFKGGGKDPTSPSSYRPISLLSCLGKVLEMLFRPRFLKALDSRGLRNPYQAGFAQGRSTEEQILRFTERAFSAFKRQEASLVVLLDFAGAFDRIWIDGLRYKMANDSIPPKITRWISNLLTNRRIQVIVNDTSSDLIIMQAGTAQGGVNSPDIYNYYTADIVDHPSRICPVIPALYADDTGALVSGRVVKTISTKMQTFLDKVDTWTNRWRLVIAPHKSEAILLTRCFNHSTADVNIQIKGVSIPLKDSVNYLGVLLDKRLTFSIHIEYIVTKCQDRLNLLRRLSFLQNRRFPRIILGLYKALILSIMSYGSVAFMQSAFDHLSKLEKIQMEALRIALGLPRYTPTWMLLRAADFPLALDHLRGHARRRLLSIWFSSPVFERDVIDRQQVTFPTRHPSPMEILGPLPPRATHPSADALRTP